MRNNDKVALLLQLDAETTRIEVGAAILILIVIGDGCTTVADDALGRLHWLRVVAI
jgi:hypothetical protein